MSFLFICVQHPYRTGVEHEGLNLVVDRAKSPMEYAVYSQPSSGVISTTQSNSSIQIATTPAEVSFAKIGPLLSQQKIVHVHHQQQGQGHHIGPPSQSQPASHGGRLLMAAPSHPIHQKEQQIHELGNRGPPAAAHQHQLPPSVISVPGVGDRIAIEIRGDFRTSSRSNSVDAPRELDSMMVKTEVRPDEASVLPITTYAPKYGFQTVLQVC